MKILIIEDEAKTAAYLCAGLTEAGYSVDHADNGIDGLYMAREEPYDLILLDVMLPQMDGWTVMEKLRARQQTPVLFLSARSALEDRLKGLGLGADEYLVKPFSFAELLARVRIILRRGQVERPVDTLDIGDLQVDVPKRRVTRAGQRLVLTNREFSLLLCFMQRRDEVLSRSLLASLVWDMNFDSDTNVVDVAVRRLRQKIDDPFPTKLIHTVHGVGYRFEHEA
ncbi:heavy metal response regulator transcription factor [Pseudomonas sp. 7P_10.2_Bac1]|uniref:heavy metal response regulator transcription factor n=1 Tax=Pseudomonas sp. 7P_10.2_Bac1 TaxID=2971614 RepID=UPI0021C83DDA|nr:heavy metal response regulator transcription factor [Pseudomonas sp. 7P_10.2_Bac1]MCU1727904.1 heavy metal response regulator transcription factor [Pseudomonas sp. 7P_10.2_Bac1]